MIYNISRMNDICKGGENMKKNILFLSIFMLVTCFTTTCLATGIEIGGAVPIPGLGDKASMILGMIQWIGFAVAIGMVIYIGIKYITAGAGGKADVKSTMVPWLAGAALIALAGPIANGIFTILGGGGGTGTGTANTDTRSDSSAYWAAQRDRENLSDR